MVILVFQKVKAVINQLDVPAISMNKILFSLFCIILLTNCMTIGYVRPECRGYFDAKDAYMVNTLFTPFLGATTGGSGAIAAQRTQDSMQGEYPNPRYNNYCEVYGQVRPDSK